MENLLDKPINCEIELADSKVIFQYVKEQEHEEQPNIETLKLIQSKNWIFPSRYHGLIYVNIQTILLKQKISCVFGQQLIPYKKAEQNDIDKMFEILNTIENKNEDDLTHIVFFVKHFKFDPKKIWLNQNNQNFLDVLQQKTSKISNECYDYIAFHYPEMKKN